MKAVLPYFDSEWDFARLKIPDTYSIATFNQDSLITLTYEGNYYLCSFDNLNGGECLIKTQLKFFETQ